MDSFPTSLIKGNRGERDFLRDYPSYKKNNDVDVRSVDLVDDHGLTVEIKTESYCPNDCPNKKHSPNYFIETISNESKNTPGAHLRAVLEHATYIVHYYPCCREYHWLDPEILWNRALEIISTGEYKLHRIKNSKYTTIGYALPRKEVASALIIIHHPKEN